MTKNRLEFYEAVSLKVWDSMFYQMMLRSQGEMATECT